MKKISRTIIALLLAVCMLVPGYASSLRASAKGSVDPTAGMVGNDHARIDQITVAGRTCYMYVPDSNRVGNFLALTPWWWSLATKPSRRIPQSRTAV